MAGTTLDRQLTTAGTARVPFALATPADDADIRCLLRENPMPGQITLTLEREPDYFADADLPGTVKQTIIANQGGGIKGFCGAGDVVGGRLDTVTIAQINDGVLRRNDQGDKRPLLQRRD